MKSKLLLLFIYINGAICIATLANSLILIFDSSSNKIYNILFAYSVFNVLLLVYIVSKSHFRKIMTDKQAKQLICIINSIGEIYSANNYFKILSSNDLEGQNIQDIVKIIDSDYTGNLVNQLLKQHRSKIPHKYILGTKNAILNARIEVVYLGQKDQQKLLKIIIEPLLIHQNMEQEADEFIELASHEIRTPLATLEGLIDNLQIETKKEILSKTTLNQQLKLAYTEVGKLSDLINDLDFLSDAKKQSKLMQYGSLSPQYIVDELKDKYYRLAQNKGLKLMAEKITSKNLITIEPYVRKIIEIFIDNAIKYTSEGQIIIKSSPYKNGVLFTVQDTGTGIEKSEQLKIFDKFYQGNDPYTRSKNGLGLSLYLANTLASKMGAEITVDSTPGKGSKFNLYIKNKISDEISHERYIQAEIDDAMASL